MFLLTLRFNLIMREWEKELLATGCNYCQESFSSDFYILDKVLYSLLHEKIPVCYIVGDSKLQKSFWFCRSIFSTSCLIWHRSTLQNNEWPPKLTHNSSKKLLSFVMPYVWHSKSKQTSLHILREVHLVQCHTRAKSVTAPSVEIWNK